MAERHDDRARPVRHLLVHEGHARGPQRVPREAQAGVQGRVARIPCPPSTFGPKHAHDRFLRDSLGTAGRHPTRPLQARALSHEGPGRDPAPADGRGRPPHGGPHGRGSARRRQHGRDDARLGLFPTSARRHRARRLRRVDRRWGSAGADGRATRRRLRGHRIRLPQRDRLVAGDRGAGGEVVRGPHRHRSFLRADPCSQQHQSGRTHGWARRAAAPAGG